jgi:HD-like signal output (HDOD) protein
LDDVEVIMGKKLLTGKELQRKILMSLDHLPPMPKIVHKARKVIEDPNSSLKDIEKLIKVDQALTISVLKMANSAYYRRVKEATSVLDAAVVLGIKTIGELITIACTSPVLSKTLKGYDISADSMWRHSLSVAFGSKIIANKKCPTFVNDAFIAGLIHDVGKLVLDKYILERGEAFREFLSKENEIFYKAEKMILGFDHAEIAEKVCKSWNFPKHINIAIKYHHYPSRYLTNELAHIVHVADEMSTWIGMDIDGRTLEISDDSMEKLDIQANEVEQILDEMIACVNQIADEVGR